MLELCKSLRDYLSIGAVSAAGYWPMGFREFVRVRFSHHCRHFLEAGRRIFRGEDGRVVNWFLLTIWFICYDCIMYPHVPPHVFIPVTPHDMSCHLWYVTVLPLLADVKWSARSR